MNPLDGEEILEAARHRREVEEIRRAAIEALADKAKPNVSGAVVNFILAAASWGFYQFINRIFEDAGSNLSIYSIVLGTVFPLWFVWSGYHCLVVDPKNRLLLLLAREATLKSDDDQGKTPPPDHSQTGGLSLWRR